MQRVTQKLTNSTNLIAEIRNSTTLILSKKVRYSKASLVMPFLRIPAVELPTNTALNLNLKGYDLAAAITKSRR